MIHAGSAKIDITPKGSVWMEGMIRSHRSDGVHDPLHARALVLVDGENIENAVAILSVDICCFGGDTASIARKAISSATGISSGNIVVAATHTHSGPVTIGTYSPGEAQYVDDMVARLAEVARAAVRGLRPAAISYASGREDTISFYRRFMSKEGRTVMIWEENPATNDLQVLGEPDPEVGALRVVDAFDPGRTIAVLFNHAGHPNVMSGENYMISADYPGVAARVIEQKLGTVALFINGAQGTMDIDNWTYRDWDGMEHLGRALADAVMNSLDGVAAYQDSRLCSSSVRYTLASRKISSTELEWAEEVLASTGGAVSCLADGVGDDYKALLYKKLHEVEANDVEVEQACIAIGNVAFISFPGELFTEIGKRIKAESPFKHTHIMGLSNGSIGYIPAIESIPQGGYEVDTRMVCGDAEDVIVSRSLELLSKAKRVNEVRLDELIRREECLNV